MSNASQNQKSWFEPVSTMDEMMKAFGEMELLDKQEVPKDPEKVISFGEKALDTLLKDENDTLAHGKSLPVARVLNLLGSACFDLKKFDESLKYFNWSNKKLSELLEDGGSSSPVLDCLVHTHLGLFKLKKAMGKREDAPRHMRKVIEIREKTMEEGSLGEAYMDVCEVYLGLFDFEEALPYCLKALGVYTKHKEECSLEVAMIRRQLGIIYTEIGEYDSALEHNQLAISVLELMRRSVGEELLLAEVQKSNILTQLGRHEEAFGGLKDIVSDGAKMLGIGGKMLAFKAMARTLCGQEKLEEARKYIDTVRRIFDEEVMDPLVVAAGLGDLSVLYEKVKDFDTAMSLLRRVLTTPVLPKKLLLKNSKRFFALASKSGKEEEWFPCLEVAVEKLKDRVGPKHSEVGYGNCCLAVACMNLHKRHEAVKYFANAKEIMDATLGPRHTDSLKTSQTLSMAYAITGRRDLAIPCQEKVVEGMKAAGPSEEKNLAEAITLLEALRSGNTMVYRGVP